MKQLIIFGDQTANEIKAVVEETAPKRFDDVQVCFVDPTTNAEANRFQPGPATHYLIGVREPSLRQIVKSMAESQCWTPFSVIHPSAYIAATATIGDGCFIAPQSVVGHRAILGDHCLLHFHASIGHDAKLGDDCWILPGARISGQVTLGCGVLVGSNAFVYQGVRIGDQAEIDALTYVRNDVEPQRVVSVRRPGLTGY